MGGREMIDNERRWQKELSALSPKHREVLDLVTRQMTSKEIARDLGLSPHTVEQRILTIRQRFGNVPRRELVRICRQAQPGGETKPTSEPAFVPTEAGPMPFTNQPDDARRADPLPMRDRVFRLPFFAAGFSVGMAFTMVANLLLLAVLR